MKIEIFSKVKIIVSKNILYRLSARHQKAFGFLGFFFVFNLKDLESLMDIHCFIGTKPFLPYSVKILPPPAVLFQAHL